jgi:predicted lipoprotein
MRVLAVLVLAMAPLATVAQPAPDPVIVRVVEDVALPGVTGFAAATAALAEAAEADCRADGPALKPAWNAAMDAWLGVQDLRFGPLEDEGRRQAIAYWPDASGHRTRALGRILSGADPILKTPELYNQESVSARGLYALEAMLHDPGFAGYGPGDPGCALVRAASADLAEVAAGVAADWGGFAGLMLSAGAPGNDRFLYRDEARQVVFTALLTSLQFDILERLGQPLGTYDKPRPLRAEGRWSKRAQRNLHLSLAAHRALAEALVPEPDQALRSYEDFDRVDWMVRQFDDPDFSGVSEPGGRFRLETLQTALIVLRAVLHEELSAALGVVMGLNSLDVD